MESVNRGQAGIPRSLLSEALQGIFKPLKETGSPQIAESPFLYSFKSRLNSDTLYNPVSTQPQIRETHSSLEVSGEGHRLV